MKIKNIVGVLSADNSSNGNICNLSCSSGKSKN